MNTEIVEVRLSPLTKSGDLIELNMNTLNRGGQDVGYQGVLADGRQYACGFHGIFSPPGGPDERFEIRGVGGTEPKWGGLNRAQRDAQPVEDRAKRPDPGTGPNGGYELGCFGDSVTREEPWIYDLGFRTKIAIKSKPKGILSVKGWMTKADGTVIETVTQTLEL